MRHQVSKIVVLRPHAGKYHRAVGEKVFTALAIDAEHVRKYAQRKYFGNIADPIEGSLRDDALNQRDGLGLEIIFQSSHCARRHDAGENFSRPCMQWRIGFENDARRTPRF